jgi:hypothetical protein
VSFSNNSPIFEISSNPTLPSPVYRSPGNSFLGIAIANPYTDRNVSVLVTVFNNDGTQAAPRKTIQLRPTAHTSFVLKDAVAGLPNNFNGSVQLAGLAQTDSFVAWTLKSELTQWRSSMAYFSCGPDYPCVPEGV